MLAPTPMLRPSPLDISGLFAGTFEVLKRRLGLFLLIALLPLVVGLVLIGAGIAIALSAGLVAFSGGARAAIPTGVILGIGLLLGGAFATMLVQVKSQAMMIVAAYEIAQGGHPDFRGLLERTKGFLPRMAPVIAIAIGAVVAIYAAFFVLLVGVIGSSSTGGRNSGAAAAGMILVMVLLFLLAIPLSLFLQTRLLYTIPAIALEQVGGIGGMKRSWSLTSGAFWRTLGQYLVASLAVVAISYVVSFVGQLAMTPMTAGLNQASDPAQVFAALAAMIPAFLLLFVLQSIVQLVVTPFLQTYVAYMFIDQVRRSDLPAYGSGGMPPAYGYYPGPSYPQPGPSYPQPGQYNGQPGQTYGQPGQYGGQPGPGYPPPGQGTQPGGWPPAGGHPPRS